MYDVFIVLLLSLGLGPKLSSESFLRSICHLFIIILSFLCEKFRRCAYVQDKGYFIFYARS